MRRIAQEVPAHDGRQKSWSEHQLVRNRKTIRKSRPFMEAGEEEPKSTSTVKLQGWNLVLPAQHQLDSSYQYNATKWDRAVVYLFVRLFPHVKFLSENPQ